MNFNSTPFGQLEIPDDKILNFSRTMLGLENSSRFCLVETEELFPIFWLQSLDEPELVLPLVNPLLFCENYRIDLFPDDIAELNLTDKDTIETYAIVSFGETFEDTTLNLQAPILINTENNRAKQVIMTNNKYKVSYSICSSKKSLTVEAQKSFTPANVG